MDFIRSWSRHGKNQDQLAQEVGAERPQEASLALLRARRRLGVLSESAPQGACEPQGGRGEGGCSRQGFGMEWAPWKQSLR
jgi:hypothetical protein